MKHLPSPARFCVAQVGDTIHSSPSTRAVLTYLQPNLLCSTSNVQPGLRSTAPLILYYHTMHASFKLIAVFLLAATAVTPTVSMPLNSECVVVPLKLTILAHFFLHLFIEKWSHARWHVILILTPASGAEALVWSLVWARSSNLGIS